MGQFVGSASYAAAAAALVLLFLLLLTGWRGRLQGGLLALACLASAAWAAVIAVGGAPGPTLSSDLLEVLRNAAWFAFLGMLLGFHRKANPTLKLSAAAVSLMCLALFSYGTWRHVALRVPLEGQGMLGGFGGAILAVAGMAMVEQLYRNVQPQQRWGIKYLCLGLGGMFAYDFYMYADAMLLRRVNEATWIARGLVDALVVPFVAVSAARNPKWSVDVFVSRRFLFHSAALVGAGVYMLMMAAAGYYIRYFGGTWGAVLQITFLFGAMLLLIAVLFSGTLRARLRVFLAKNFFSYRFDYRDEWLRFTRRLSEGEPGVQLQRRAVHAIADMVESPAGALWLSQGAVFELVANWNMPQAAGTEAASGEFCQFLERRQWVVSVEECLDKPQIYGGLALPSWLTGIPDAWCVVPLIQHEQLLGFVVLARSLAGVPLNWEVRDLLKTAGRQAASYLAQLEAARQLLVARQFESFSRMTAFVAHDLKNLVSQLSMLLANAQKHRDNPEFQEDMLATIGNSVEKMKRLMLQLRRSAPTEPPGRLCLVQVLGRIVQARRSCRPAPQLEAVEAALEVCADAEKLERVLGHLVQNAVEATPPDGSVRVALSRRDPWAVIEIVDTGCGMSERFLQEALFRPFESTKATGMGIGAYESREYVRELGGRIEVSSREGAGSAFRVWLPLASEQAQASVTTARDVA